MIDDTDDLPGPELDDHRKKKDPFEGYRDYKQEVIDIIDELENESNLTFRKDEVFERTDYRKIPREEAEAVFDDLLASGYIQERHGTDGLYEKTGTGDFSPAHEELPDWN
ncbi:MAG: hypothetical protein ABIF92_02200 [archaeon]